MTSFADLTMISRVSTPNPPTKPRTYDFGVHNEKILNNLCKHYGLNEEEKELLRLTEIEKYPFNQIGEILGVTRQCVYQKHRNLWKRTVGKKSNVIFAKRKK